MPRSNVGVSQYPCHSSPFHLRSSQLPARDSRSTDTARGERTSKAVMRWCYGSTSWPLSCACGALADCARPRGRRSWRVAAARPGDAGGQGVAVRTAWTTPTPDTSNILPGGGEGAPSARAGRALRWLGGSMLMPGGHTPARLASSRFRLLRLSPLIRQLHA